MKIIFTICLLTLASIGYTQTTTTTYYKDEYCSKEAAPEKAKFSKTITHHEDGSVTTETKDLEKDLVMRSETFKGNEQFGTWIKNGKRSHYNFDLVYTDTGCHSLPDPLIKDPFTDNVAIGYVAPKLTSGEPLSKYLYTNLNYPSYALENGYSGKVVLVFIIDKNGTVQHLAISETSKYACLDKEAMRIVKEMKFSRPPLLNGVPQSFCFIFPVSFKLE